MLLRVGLYFYHEKYAYVHLSIPFESAQGRGGGLDKQEPGINSKPNTSWQGTGNKITAQGRGGVLINKTPELIQNQTHHDKVLETKLQQIKLSDQTPHLLYCHCCANTFIPSY